MEKSKWPVHQAHCCEKHGCKYGDMDCPVEQGYIKQDHPCECCDMDMLNPSYGVLELLKLWIIEQVECLNSCVADSTSMEEEIDFQNQLSSFIAIEEKITELENQNMNDFEECY